MGARRKKSKKPSGTKAEQLLEQTVFFVDVCLGRHVGEVLREAGLKIEFHADHFEDTTPDEEWLAVVAQRGWVVLTKDKAIRRRPRERDAVIAAQVRMFALPSGNLTGEEMAERYRDNRLRMARFMLNNQPPFVGVVHSETITLAPLSE